MTRTQRIRYLAFYAFWCIGLYKLIQVVTPLLHGSYYNIGFHGEDAIPFVPEMFPIYLTVYVIPPSLLFLLPRESQIRTTLKVFAIATLTHAFFFLAFPVKYVLRPDLAPHWDDLLLSAVHLMYVLDAPYNNFPSMHVSYAFLSFFCIRSFRPKWAKAFLVIAVAIALSTLLVKQHYVLDVVAALILAWGLSQLYLSRKKSTRQDYEF